MAQSVGQIALDLVLNGADKIGGTLSKLGGAAKVTGAVMAAGIGAASAAIVSVGKAAIDSYGEYEQLTGGVETLFKDMADEVIVNAGNAYKTAGMSANAYMQTVTSFSASLLQSVGSDTVKAANMADMAITDMSDNANKMGTSMEMIQNAYQGFAKQNYTMLDNLKLGYGGTKTEMERLLADAQAISGIEYDISSYADVVDAIHVIQTEMGITGTTAKEASSTIQGSLAAMGSSWQNLLTGLTDPTQNFDQLVTNFVDSVGTAAQNLVPRLTNVLDGVVNLITQLAPVIVAELPNMVQTILPPLLEGAISLVNAVLLALPSMMQMIVEMLPTLIPMLINGLVSMIVSLCSNLEQIIQPIIDNLPYILQVTVDALLSNLPLLLQGVIDLTVALLNAFLQVLGAILGPIGTWIYDNVIVPVGQFFADLWAGVTAGVQAAWDWCVGLCSTIGAWVYENVIAPVAQFFTDLWNGIVTAYHTVIDPWVEIIMRAAAIVNEKIIQPIKNFFTGLWEDIKGVFAVVGSWFSTNVIQPVQNAFTNAWNFLKNGASNAWSGIKSVFSSVATFFGDIFKKAWEKVKAVFSVGGKIFDGIKDGIVSAFKNVVNAIIRGINKVVSVPFNAINSVLNKLRGVSILGVSPFGWLGRISVPKIPELEYGAVLKKGQVGLLEGKGAEAVVPLERNTGWLTKIATMLTDRIDIQRAFDLPALQNVRAGTPATAQDNSKLDRIIELIIALLDKGDPKPKFPIYIGNELVDEYIMGRNTRKTLRSGGRA